MFSSVARSCSPILCKARGSGSGHQLGSAQLGSAPFSLARPRLLPTPMASQGARQLPGPRRRRTTGTPLTAPLSPLAGAAAGFEPVLRGFSVALGFLFRSPPRCVGALSQAGGRLLVLSGGVKPPRSRSCPRPRWRRPARPVTAPPSAEAAPGGRRGGLGPGKRNGGGGEGGRDVRRRRRRVLVGKVEGA